MSYKEKIKRLIEIDNLIPLMKNTAKKLALISEREEILSENPFIYDKYYGLQQDGII